MSKPMLARLIRAYAKHYEVDLHDALEPVENFDTFNEFFSRKLKPGARNWSQAKDEVISPVDGTVQKTGRIKELSFEPVKGHSYTIGQLLQDDELAARFENGRFIVIYLSPRNYHRIHSPAEGTIRSFRYQKGTLVSVQPFFYNLVSGLLVSNERVNTHIETALGDMVVSKVGACGVGRIRLSYSEFASNMKLGAENEYRELDVKVGKADDLGSFELGSTVVLLLSNDELRLVDGMKPGTEVRMGQVLYRLR